MGTILQWDDIDTMDKSINSPYISPYISKRWWQLNVLTFHGYVFFGKQVDDFHIFWKHWVFTWHMLETQIAIFKPTE